MTNGQAVVNVLDADDVDDRKITTSSEKAETHEEEGPEVASGTAILKNMLILHSKLQAVNLFVGECLDCTNVAQGLRSHVAELGLGVLVSDSELVKEGGTNTSDQDLWDDECHDDESQLNVIGEHDSEDSDANAG